ncbi:MAG: ATP-dependent DNA helicase [Methanomicrobiales archaeon]|nr:ATP-dependent DNA helicase [Methanomicrobiales archaeon]
MKIGSLPIPDTLIRQYESAGVRDLYPPQAECVEKGMFEGKNLLVAIPTASGKTLVAETAMHFHIAKGGKCLYIVPLKALASEKFEDFSGKGVRVGISTGDYDRRDDYLGRNDIIVATSEKVDSLLRNASPWLQDISLLVIDEVHLIDSPDRGPTLEMVITKMRTRNPSMQVIALSATIGNPGSLSRWLDAELVTGSWRPVDLRQGVYYEGAIHFHSDVRPVRSVSKFEDLNLLMDTIDEGGQCLVFVSSRKNAEAFAKRAAKALHLESPELATYAKQLGKLAETEQEKALALCASSGSAFHHAGLRRATRSIVEEGFRKGHIKCISSTPTLAAGLNLPARRVIIRDYRRYSAGEGMVPIPAREYHQMAGRAGRPHLDPYGEAVLIGHSSQDAAELFSYYIDAPPEDVNSQCSTERALTTHILSLIASGFVTSLPALQDFMRNTFYFHQKKTDRLLTSVIGRSLSFLDRAEMITIQGDYFPATEYGTLVSQLYVDPLSADIIVEQITGAEDYSDIGLLQVICSTPDMFTLFVANRDRHYLERFVLEHDDELWLDFPYGEDESYFRGLKTAMVLYDWSHEVPDATICERYSIGPGDIHALVESVNWLLHATGRLTRMFRRNFTPSVGEFELCMKHGIKRELIPLVRIRNIGRVRARRLFNSGFTSPEKILAAGEERIIPILGHGITSQVFSFLKGKESGNTRVSESASQADLFQFGNRETE